MMSYVLLTWMWWCVFHCNSRSEDVPARRHHYYTSVHILSHQMWHRQSFVLLLTFNRCIGINSWDARNVTNWLVR